MFLIWVPFIFLALLLGLELPIKRQIEATRAVILVLFFILEKDSSPYCHSYDVSLGLSFIGFTMLRHLPSITILRDFTINGDSVYPVFSIFSERITPYIVFYLLYPQEEVSSGSFNTSWILLLQKCLICTLTMKICARILVSNMALTD